MLLRQLLVLSFVAALIQPLASARAADSEIAAVQRALNEQGYDPGPIDGVLGRQTSAAIREFEKDHLLLPTGQPSLRLLVALRKASEASPTALDPDGPPASTAEREASAVVENVEERPIRTLERLTPMTRVSAAPLDGPATVQPWTPRQRETPFAPRNWLIRDLSDGNLPVSQPFGVFLEEGGSVVGPRFATRLRWEADGRQFTMSYRNAIGQEIHRTGTLEGPDRIIGEATGPGGVTWRWTAEAEPR
jgi:peptidoglycan hydrolase-like protein with peptidoglycan-binding domain